MATKARKPQQLDYPRAEFSIARYSGLSEEKQSRYSNVYQMTSLNLTISAAILTFGLQPSSTASVFFVVPILSMLMGIVVAYNFQTARRLARIQSDIEAEFNFASKDLASPQGRIISRFTGLFGAGGLFLIVQILASALGLLKIQHYTTLDIVLIIGDVLSVLIVLWVISATSRAIKEEASAQKAG